MIALASVETAHSQPGTKLQMEITIEAVRQKVTATVAKLPFFNPERKTTDAGVITPFPGQKKIPAAFHKRGRSRRNSRRR